MRNGVKGLWKGTPSWFTQTHIGSITNFALDKEDKGYTIPFMFSPSGLSDSIVANVQQTQIPGSSAPQITYSSTGARQVSLSLEIPLDYLPPNSPYTDFEDYLNAFRALVYPKYSAAGGRVESPHCKLITSNIELDGVCTNCAIEYKTDRYADDGSMAAQVSLSFIEVLDNVKDVDAKWIIDSKVNVLGDTIMTVQSEEARSAQSASVRVVDDTSKCYISLKGNATYDISSTNSSLLYLMKQGIWMDPGYTYTNQDKFTVKVFWGFVREATKSSNRVDNIQVAINNGGVTGGSCVVDGITCNLQSQCPNAWGQPGDIISYFAVYIPLYDGNKFDVSQAKSRFVYLTVINKDGN